MEIKNILQTKSELLFIFLNEFHVIDYLWD